MLAAPTPTGGLAKPRLRGVSHQWAFFASLGLGALLLVLAGDPRETVAAAVYAASVAGLLGTSALYHRVRWSRESVRRWMRRADHAAIFVLIAGTCTPFGLLVLEGATATAVLVGVWSGAAAGIALRLAWIDAPARLSALVYVGLGWAAAAALPGLVAGMGLAPTLLVAGGGVLYTLGALVYALRRPDPVPAVFGFHEVFHVFVLAAAALQYVVIAVWVL